MKCGKSAKLEIAGWECATDIMFMCANLCCFCFLQGYFGAMGCLMEYVGSGGSLNFEAPQLADH